MEKDLRRLQTSPSPLRSAGVTDLGNPLLRGLGVVFGGRDLYGDTFSRPRDFLTDGEPELKLGTNYYLTELADEIDLETGELRGALSVPVFWDHGLGVLGPKRLGKAIPTKITQEGIEYLIEIEKKRAQDYQAMIDELVMSGWLGLSTQTLPSFANFDWSTQEIKGWFPAELTLTVTPAEHRTRDAMQQVRSLFRKYGIEVDTMTLKTIAEDPNEVVAAQDENPTDVVDELLEDLDAQITEEADAVLENQALAYVVNAMDEFTVQMRTLVSRLDEIDARIAKSVTEDQLQQMNADFVESLRKMTSGLADVLTKAVRSRAAEVIQSMPETEINAIRNVGQPGAATQPSVTRRSMYNNLPPNAPGQN